MVGIITIVLIWLAVRYLIKRADTKLESDHQADWDAGRTRAKAEDARMRRLAQHIAQATANAGVTVNVPKSKTYSNSNVAEANFKEIQ